MSANPGYTKRWLIELMIILVAAQWWMKGAKAIDIYLDWDVTLDTRIQPVSAFQPVRTIFMMLFHSNSFKLILAFHFVIR